MLTADDAVCHSPRDHAAVDHQDRPLWWAFGPRIGKPPRRSPRPSPCGDAGALDLILDRTVGRVAGRRVGSIAGARVFGVMSCGDHRSPHFAHVWTRLSRHHTSTEEAPRRHGWT